MDELILAMVVTLIAGLIFAIRRIYSLEAQVAELETKRQKAQQIVTLSEDHADCVIRCVDCGKYQMRGDRWLSREDFATLTQHTNVLAGVCPSCRLPFGD